jgi:acyl-CoA dehydrogenase
MKATEVEVTTDPFETDERRALRAMSHAFVVKHVSPNLERWEEEGEIPGWLHERAAEAGLLGITFPERVGGAGGSVIDLVILHEEIILAGGTSGLSAALLTHGIALPHIVDSGNSSLIDRYVRPTLAGKMIGALGITEPDGGSDVANLRTRAVLDGDEYVVSGAKLYITSGCRANFVTTAVRTGGAGHKGISLLVIDTALPGVSVSRRLRKMGWLCSDTAELAFDEVRVPRVRLVGEAEGGFRQIMQQFQVERLFLATDAYATAQRCIDLTLEWVKVRRTFGSPLADRQAVRHLLAEMSQRTAAAKALTRQAALALGRDDNATLLVSMAKNVATDACLYVVDKAVQLHGGLGYMRETEVERHYRDAKVLSIGGGSTEIMKDVVAKHLGL